ncbi:unnamed protein product [Phyllotreta striolata]|uniref:Uncharacterized protein n=1 Tax=Phyllotreta striolata TaxID=444603 RepID=A0A9N9TUH1_PHYSR|nr:unnamed protein product [Phyllotreta striolata]
MIKFALILVSSLVVRGNGKELNSCGESLECLDEQLKLSVNELELPSYGEWISVHKIARTSRKINEDEDFVGRCVRFLMEHELRIRVPERQERSLESESRSKRLRKLILPIILLLKLKAAIVIPVVLTIISFLAFTGFKSGLAALAISGAVALKNLLEHSHHGHSKISYEILPSLGSGWSRTSQDEGLALPGYQPIP